MAPHSPSRALAFGLVLLVSGILAAAEPPSDEEHALNAFKGFELYSWRDGSGHCAYAFLPGTNRLKLPEEIERSRISRAEVTAAFERLVVGDSVSWANRVADADPGSSFPFAYPPPGVIAELQKAAEQKGAELWVPEASPEPTCQPGGADSDSGTLKPR